MCMWYMYITFVQSNIIGVSDPIFIVSTQIQQFSISEFVGMSIFFKTDTDQETICFYIILASRISSILSHFRMFLPYIVVNVYFIIESVSPAFPLALCRWTYRKASCRGKADMRQSIERGVRH